MKFKKIEKEALFDIYIKSQYPRKCEQHPFHFSIEYLTERRAP